MNTKLFISITAYLARRKHNVIGRNYRKDSKRDAYISFVKECPPRYGLKGTAALLFATMPGRKAHINEKKFNAPARLPFNAASLWQTQD